MTEKCENLTTCTFFKTFFARSTAVKNSWIQLYCENREKSDHCARKKIKNSGQTPPENMAPTGKLLKRIGVPERR